jgi:hypothetical protein
MTTINSIQPVICIYLYLFVYFSYYLKTKYPTLSTHQLIELSIYSQGQIGAVVMSFQKAVEPLQNIAHAWRRQPFCKILDTNLLRAEARQLEKKGFDNSASLSLL